MVKPYEQFIKEHPTVEAWIRNRPRETRRKFASYLQDFCKTVNVDPEEWRHLDKFEARDLAWKYVEPKTASNPTVAKGALTTLKNWYRNLNGEQLPFDSNRGGKHYFHVTHKKYVTEHIPNKTEIYQIVDMASSLRDKAILLFLFQSGVRVNVLEHLTYGDVQDELNKEVMAIRVTENLDHKLRGRNIPFYYTFLNGEGAETLRRYCEVKHKDSTPETPLFYTKGKRVITQAWIWKIVKMCVKRAGFNPKTMSTHTIRKSFRKIVRQTNIDDDDKEQLMGHVIKGSRLSYFDKKDVDLIREAYLKCNFTKEQPQSEVTKLRKQLETSETKRLIQETRLEELETRFKMLTKNFESLNEKLKEMAEK